MADAGALVVYGRGADLGDFRLFAEDLPVTELAGFERDRIRIERIERRDAFFDLLRNTDFGFKLKALHIYSHAFGGGLSLGYGDPTLTGWQSVIDTRRGGRAWYLSVLNASAGTVFTDDLIRAPYKDYREKLRSLFTADGYIKIWGCNSGVSGWIYTDQSAAGQRVSDPDAEATSYYWRALNERNTPKPSIAQAFADYFQVKVLGAISGSSIQARIDGQWVSATREGKITVNSRLRYVQERDVLRLNPDRGEYREYYPH